MTELLDWFFPAIVGNGTLLLIVAGAVGWLWSRMQQPRERRRSNDTNHSQS